MNWYDPKQDLPICQTKAKFTNLEKRSVAFQEGYNAAKKDMLAWLHHEAESFSDWRAKKILNAAASELGSALAWHNANLPRDTRQTVAQTVAREAGK